MSTSKPVPNRALCLLPLVDFSQLAGCEGRRTHADVDFDPDIDGWKDEARNESREGVRRCLAKSTLRRQHDRVRRSGALSYRANLVTTAPPPQGTAAGTRGSAIRVGRPQRADRRHRILFFPPTQHLQNREGARGAVRNERERAEECIYCIWGRTGRYLPIHWRVMCAGFRKDQSD